MTVDQMAAHAKRYSKGLKAETTVESLLNLANLPVLPDSKTVGWMGNFHGMGIKTVIRNLLGKYGYLSVEMQQAIADDTDGDTENRDNLVQENGNVQVFNATDVQYEEVSTGNATQADPNEINPEY